MNAYLQGTSALASLCPRHQHVIGAQAQGASSHRAVLVRVKDVGAVVRAKAPGAGDLLSSFVPETLEQYVYDQVAQQLASGLKDKGVDADVQVVSSPASGPPPGTEVRGMVYGALAVGLGYGLFRGVRALLSRRK